MDFKSKKEKEKECEYKVIFEKTFLKQIKKHIKTKTHNLKGKLKGLTEAHIKNDLLIIWEKRQKNIILIIIGTHSELFN